MAQFAHPLTGNFGSEAEATTFANDFISASNAADFAGRPASSYSIAKRAGIYGTRFLVEFAA